MLKSKLLSSDSLKSVSCLELYYQSKRYCPVLVALEDFAFWGNTLATALLLKERECHLFNFTMHEGFL